MTTSLQLARCTLHIIKNNSTWGPDKLPKIEFAFEFAEILVIFEKLSACNSSVSRDCLSYTVAKLAIAQLYYVGASQSSWFSIKIIPAFIQQRVSMLKTSGGVKTDRCITVYRSVSKLTVICIQRAKSNRAAV